MAMEVVVAKAMALALALEKAVAIALDLEVAMALAQPGAVALLARGLRSMRWAWRSLGKRRRFVMDEDLGEIVMTLYLDALAAAVEQQEKPALWEEPQTKQEGTLQNELSDLHDALQKEEYERTGDISMDHYAAALAVVMDQAQDNNLWRAAETVREACLQKDLRLLHAILESDEDVVGALERVGGIRLLH